MPAAGANLPVLSLPKCNRCLYHPSSPFRASLNKVPQLGVGKGDIILICIIL